MTADTQQELDEMAENLGFKAGHKHYTLTPRQWEEAVDLGAEVPD